MNHLLRLRDPLAAYGEVSDYIDWDHPAVLAQAQELGCAEAAGWEYLTRAYHFVRDEIAHSWDAGIPTVTRKASEVLAAGTGICWAKANLLAALLRAGGIPAGVCYQRLTLEDTPSAGFCLHCLNAALLPGQDRWQRLDARGNRADIHAELRLDREQIAFPVRPWYQERDLPGVYARPAPGLMESLEGVTDILAWSGQIPDTWGDD